MSDKKVHYANTEASNQMYQVFYKNEVILESDNIVKLKEHYDTTDFPPVIYFPPSALINLKTSKTEHSTHCPIKGDASYWSYQEAENGIWSYENPNQGVEGIKNHFSFDQKQGFRIILKTQQ